MLAEALRKTHIIYAEYLKTENANKLPIDLGAITEIISSNVKLPIKFHQQTWSDASIKGYLLRYEGHAEIHYSANLNTCWERLVVCKEACHLIIDDETSFAKDPLKLVDALVSANICKPNDNPGRAELSEHLAEIAALELLFPIHLRREMYNAHQDGLSILKIAHQYKIPAHYVERAFSSLYREIIDVECLRVKNSSG